jgi:hypothetical protein
MMRLFRKLYFSILYTFLPGPIDAERPILIIVEDSNDKNDIPLA